MKILRIFLIILAIIFPATFKTGCTHAHAYTFSESYSFTIMDSPHILIISPTNKAININRDSKIIFEITHPVNIKSITISVKTSTDKTIDGSLTKTPILNGFHCEFTPKDLYPALTTIIWKLEINI